MIKVWIKFVLSHLKMSIFTTRLGWWATPTTATVGPGEDWKLELELKSSWNKEIKDLIVKEIWSIA